MNSWVSKAINTINADYQRSADTHLIKLEQIAFQGIDIYLKDESTHPNIRHAWHHCGHGDHIRSRDWPGQGRTCTRTVFHPNVVLLLGGHVLHLDS